MARRHTKSRQHPGVDKTRGKQNKKFKTLVARLEAYQKEGNHLEAKRTKIKLTILRIMMIQTKIQMLKSKRIDLSHAEAELATKKELLKRLQEK